MVETMKNSKVDTRATEQQAAPTVVQRVSTDRLARGLLSAAVLAASTGSGIAAAQKAPALEEIVVTAQQREESLQDVPIAISAFSETDIQSNMFRDVTDFMARTPNASFVSNGARSRREISMRGVTNFVGANNARRTSTFGFYVDGAAADPCPATELNWR